MKIARRIVLSSVALLVAAALVVTVMTAITGDTSAIGSAQPGSGGTEPFSQAGSAANSITSDGKVYSFKRIDAVPLEKTLPKETLPAVGNRETLLKLLKERGAMYDGGALVKSTRGFDNGLAFDAIDDGVPVPAPGEAPAADWQMENAESGGGGGHSETNEQTAGVSEGDIVKTDGRYLYALSGNTLRIIRADGADMDAVSKIEFGDIWGAEFYLVGDKIAVVGQRHISIALAKEKIADGAYWYPGGRDCTVLLVYDVADRANPAEIRRVEMDGYSVATRVIGETVYLVTNKHVWAPYEQADSELIMPCFRDTAEEFVPFDFDNMFYIPGAADSGYLLTGAVDLSRDEPFAPTAYLGAGSQLYMSRDAIYVTKWSWRDDKEQTDILRFAIDGTEITYTGMGTVDGSPINQYSMDEYNGFFRIATTQWGVGTRVTVLDAGMNAAGRTEPLEPDERMQSMRFMGDMGYVVTFQNTDPLFTIDLSDPYNPKVLGELKIPGFSQYLHPVGGGLLMGIGRDTQEIYTKDKNGVETVVGFRDVGLKVSLFDVSDPYNPKETDVLPLGEGWAEVSFNPRALMCDPSRGLYGFAVERWNHIGQQFSALVLRVEGGRLSVAADLAGEDKFTAWNSRMCFIGDTLYLIHYDGVRAYDYYTFGVIGKIAW